jgi:carboxyl-terminal processing protease
MNAQATAFSMFVKVSMMNALNMSSVIPMTNGDQAGVAHPTVMGAARYTMGNPIVFVDKQPAICLLCPTTGNNMNAPLGAVLVPSAVNVFYTFAADSAEATWLTDVRQRLETLRQASVTAAVAGDVLLLRVAAFPADVVRRVHVALMGLPLDEVRAVAIDLRGNPGGELSAAVDLAADFLPDGSLVARVVDADGDEEDLRTTRAPRFDLPVTVFVDHDTASAAEVFASALRNAGRGVLVGKPTRGKMTSSTLLTQPDGAGEVTHVLSCISAAGPLVPEVVHAP